jgi:hypothetical protein
VIVFVTVTVTVTVSVTVIVSVRMLTVIYSVNVFSIKGNCGRRTRK